MCPTAVSVIKFRSPRVLWHFVISSEYTLNSVKSSFQLLIHDGLCDESFKLLYVG